MSDNYKNVKKKIIKRENQSTTAFQKREKRDAREERLKWWLIKNKSGSHIHL